MILRIDVYESMIDQYGFSMQVETTEPPRKFLRAQLFIKSEKLFHLHIISSFPTHLRGGGCRQQRCTDFIFSFRNFEPQQKYLSPLHIF